MSANIIELNFKHLLGSTRLNSLNRSFREGPNRVQQPLFKICLCDRFSIGFPAVLSVHPAIASPARFNPQHDLPHRKVPFSSVLSYPTAYTKFNWEDPLDLNSLLTEEEVQISSSRSRRVTDEQNNGTGLLPGKAPTKNSRSLSQ